MVDRLRQYTLDGNNGITTVAYIAVPSGTVTSVAQTFTGGLISVGGSPITTSGTLALTVAGTSGGVPYFSANNTWASSGVLVADALVKGGGAGVAPSTITTGTGVLTALGVNVGSAGAFVTFNGALGTPSSGTLTNATGLPISSGVSGLGTGVATALVVNTGTDGAFVVKGGALGTPSSGVATNLTGTASGLTAGTATNQSGGSVNATTGAFSGLLTFGESTYIKQDSFRVNDAADSINIFRANSGGNFNLYQIGTTASAANAYIDNGDSNNVRRSTSSLDYKRDVEPIDDSALENVLKLSGIWYRSKAPMDNPAWSWYGMGAEDVAEVDPRLVHYGRRKIGERDEEYEDEGVQKIRKVPVFGELVPDGVQYDRIAVLDHEWVKRLVAAARAHGWEV